MWEFIKRLFRIGKAEANNAVDKLERPITMTKQGIRDLKKDLDDSLKSLAEVKATAIRSKREANNHKEAADDYKKKAKALLQMAVDGRKDEADANRLAAEAMSRREETLKLYQISLENQTKFEGLVTKMEGKIRTLKSQIAKWENELKTLIARDKVSKATGKLNKELANIDSGGTLAMLEKMKEKVEEQEALADAYGEMADESKTIDDEIDAALGDTGIHGSSALDDLKREMGLMPEEEEKIEIKEKVEDTIKIEVDKTDTTDNDAKS
ncbi:MAG: PspA/IM30 family protein [Saprospiraceae bacterium]|nr:PspA/IM30 family protein [Saprospiraceae bacterium]